MRSGSAAPAPRWHGRRWRPAPAGRPARRAPRRCGTTRAAGHDETRGGAAEQAAHVAEAARAGHEDALADAAAGRRDRPRRRGRRTRSRARADSPCPGNGGMRPDQSRRSVPVLMPLHSMSTTTSSSPGRSSGKRLSTSCSGSSRTTASVFIDVDSRLRRVEVPAGLSTRLSVYTDTIIVSSLIYTSSRDQRAGDNEPAPAGGVRSRRRMRANPALAQRAAAISRAVRGRPLPIASR